MIKKICSFENKNQKVLIEYEYSGGIYYWLSSENIRSHETYKLENLIKDAIWLYADMKNFKVLAEVN